MKRDSSQNNMKDKEERRKELQEQKKEGTLQSLGKLALTYACYVLVFITLLNSYLFLSYWYISNQINQGELVHPEDLVNSLNKIVSAYGFPKK